MANQVHLDRIRKASQSGDSEGWNKWRSSKYRMDEVHGYMSLVKVDLSGADLSGLMSLGHLDLADVDFRGASLRHTELSYGCAAARRKAHPAAGPQVSTSGSGGKATLAYSQRARTQGADAPRSPRTVILTGWLA